MRKNQVSEQSILSLNDFNSEIMTSKIAFSCNSSGSHTIESSWKSEKDNIQQDFSCQTSDDLYEFDEAETQTTISAEIGTQMTKVRHVFY